eukprot:4063534-Amphidinium_carterae.1
MSPEVERSKGCCCTTSFVPEGCLNEGMVWTFCGASAVSIGSEALAVVYKSAIELKETPMECDTVGPSP